MMIDPIISMKGKEKVVVVTAYDYCMARIMDGLVDIILVGDSLGMVVLGYDSTRYVTMEDMVRHTGAVRRGAENTLIVADLPYLADKDAKAALKNARRLMDAGCHAVKLESKPEIVKALVKSGIPVMGHAGLLPQTAESFSVKGRDAEGAEEIKMQAGALAKAGAFAVVLECIPHKLAEEITEEIAVPTIGIGAGPHCDGQVLVSTDLLGLYGRLKPKFVRHYLDGQAQVRNAVKHYAKDVRSGKFPTIKESYNS